MTRLLIGVFEAGFYPTAVAYLTLFYYPFDLGVRIGVFYGLYVVANAFSAAMAYGIFQIQVAGLKSWQLLFIIQGLMTCLLAMVAWVWLPAGLESAWFLSEQEKEWVRERVNPGVSTRKRSAKVTWRDVVETARDWKLWFVLIFNICASVPTTAFSVFLPLVVQGMGYSSVEANLVRYQTLSDHLCANTAEDVRAAGDLRRSRTVPVCAELGFPAGARIPHLGLDGDGAGGARGGGDGADK